MTNVIIKLLGRIVSQYINKPNTMEYDTDVINVNIKQLNCLVLLDINNPSTLEYNTAVTSVII